MGSGLVILDNAPMSVADHATLESSGTLVNDYLREQQDLTAVEKFSQLHENTEHRLQESYYRDLLPATSPAPGSQYAFEVDLDLCTGCKGCVTACKSLNGLAQDESWRDVGLLHGRGEQSAMQHVTTACHHCLEPACASGCPVNAYVKLEDTGIVKHLDDQCIGCQYCTLTCPYDVPKFSKELGIVRKCDMCSDRLAEGEAPACVQACPSEAIRITIVSEDEVTARAEVGMVVPDAPPSNITFPTTRFKTERASVRELLPADYDAPQKQHDHAPLIFMLVLTQIAVGVFLADWFMRLQTSVSNPVGAWGSAVGLGVCVLALAASIFHLGRPQYAFRAVVGLRHSWLSREILAFGLFAKAAGILALVSFMPLHLDSLGEPFVAFYAWVTPSIPILESVTVSIGLIAVYCSVMVYHVTRRIFWNTVRTLPKFFLTTVVGGASTLLTVGLIKGALSEGLVVEGTWARPLVGAVVLGTVIKLTVEAQVFFSLRDKTNSSLKRTARLHLEHMKHRCLARLGCALLGGIVVPLALGNALSNGVMSYGGLGMLCLLGLGAVVLGELLERYLFFTAVVALKMPGGIPR